MARTLSGILAVIAGWFLVILWIASPIDPIPDVVPGVGWLDDLMVLSLALVGTVAGVWRLAEQPVLVEEKPAYEPVDPVELQRW